MVPIIESKFSTFENHTNAILNEAIGDTLNAAQKAMKVMSPGSDLFNGPGNITNSYDDKKRYYPNIRSGFGGLVNTGQDTAAQNLINRISQLEQIDTWDPSTQLPANLNGIVSTQYSQQFIPTAEAEIANAVNALKTAHDRLPRDNQDEKSYQLLLNTDTSNMSKQQYAELRRWKSEWSKKVNDLLSGKSTNYTPMAMLQKAHIQSYIREFETAFEKWFKITRTVTSLQGPNGSNSVQGSSNQQVDTNDKMVPGTTFLRNDITIYRDQWENFLEIVKNATVGTGQRGYSAGADTHSILSGSAPGTYKRKGEVSYKDQSTIAPDVLKKFHEKIMIPLFMSGKGSILIYATPEQWESISKGGRLYKAITGAGKEAFQAGQNIPKVRL